MKIRILLCLLMIFAFSFVGCGKKKKEVTIQGTVNVAGKPVDAGVIQFVPVNKDTFEGGGNIENGKFTAIVPYGEMNVRFRGIEYAEKDAEGNPVGGTFVKDAQGAVVSFSNPPSKKLIPDRYWYESDVRVTVENGKKPFDFDLEAK